MQEPKPGTNAGSLYALQEKTAAARRAAARRPRQPDPDKGEFLDENDEIRVCAACKPRPRVKRHVCGLAGLQRMFPLG